MISNCSVPNTQRFGTASKSVALASTGADTGVGSTGAVLDMMNDDFSNASFQWQIVIVQFQND